MSVTVVWMGPAPPRTLAGHLLTCHPSSSVLPIRAKIAVPMNSTRAPIYTRSPSYFGNAGTGDAPSNLLICFDSWSNALEQQLAHATSATAHHPTSPSAAARVLEKTLRQALMKIRASTPQRRRELSRRLRLALNPQPLSTSNRPRAAGLLVYFSCECL